VKLVHLVAFIIKEKWSFTLWLWTLDTFFSRPRQKPWCYGEWVQVQMFKCQSWLHGSVVCTMCHI